MKKSKLSIGLVTSFIAAMALTACSSSAVKSNKTNLVTGKGYDDEELSVLTDEIYDDYARSSSGISKYYDQVMEVLIRHAFKKNLLNGVKKNYDRIVNEAKDSVKSAKNTAKNNAETNGTSYKTEWQSILSSKGVKDEKELLESYIYDLEKTEVEDWYFDQHEEQLKKEYIGVDADGKSTESSKVKARYPYHVRHILVKVEDGGSDFVRGTISSDQAKLLSSTAELLAQGVMTFGEVALKKSEDSSNTSYGDLDPMTNAASGGHVGMVNEFQLGIYAYDAINKNATKNTEVIDKALGLNAKQSDDAAATDTVKKYFTDRGIAEVPYSVFKELGDVAELEANYKTGIPVEDNKSAIYPRNLLWNRYLNNHSIFVITNSNRPNNSTFTNGQITAGTQEKVIEAVTGQTYANKDTYFKYDFADRKAAYEASLDPTDPDYDAKVQAFVDNETITYGADGLKRFKAAELTNGDNRKVLCDENDNVIIGVRSQYGIHFMIVQKSVYDYDDKGTDGENNPADSVTLDEYYTTAIPGDSDYPVFKKDTIYKGKSYKAGDDKPTYVNFISSVNKSEYNTRADKVRSAIKSFDSTYDYRLYEELATAQYGVDMSNEKTQKLLNGINDYIKDQQRKNRDAQDQGMEDVWQTYIELLENQDFYRQKLTRVIPEGCKIAFTGNADDAAYKEGGACYVK